MKYALNASSYIMLYYIAYVLLLGHRRLALPPRRVQCVCKCRKCIYLYFFSEISIYFCVLSFWSPGTLWHNSKHNKMRTSWDWEIRGVPSRFLFNNILCGHKKKKEKRKTGEVGFNTFVLREHITYYKECRGISTLQVFETCSVCCVHTAQGLRRETDSRCVSVLCPAVKELL